MENNSVEVISVAEGVILDKYDSFSDDICGADYPNGLPDYLNDQWNYIVIEHGNGTIAIYGHLSKNSLTYKIEGQTVGAGEYLGIVGSSGMSYEPHLHLEIWDNTWNGNWIEGDIEASLDPFYGDCNYSNDASLWINQKPYIDPAILRIMTHSSIPEWQDCIPSILYDEEPIGPGNTFYIGVYHRDHFLGQESQYRVYDQSGTIDINMIWTDLFEGEDTHCLGPEDPATYQDSLGRTYWIESWRKYPLTIPADTSAMGEWKIEIDFEGVTYEQSFNVGYNGLISISEINILESVGDSDLVLNPGESINITFNINNSTLFNVVELSGAIDCDSDDIIINNNIYYNSILSGESITNSDQPFSLEFSQNIEFDEFDCNINLIYYNELDEEFSTDLLLTLPPISINQAGFPVSTAELRSSPLVIDLDGDGDMEIIAGDNNGFVHIYNADGSEVEDDTFPYDTGNQIWGSAAAADMDRDGFMDFVITSKSKHLYIFDQNGLKIDYNANKYLMGTPAIGNLDGDGDLEVVVGGYSSNNQIFAVNPDGSNVDGFPLALGEKTKAGVALADFNGNGKDDIVVGTDSDNLYLIYDDGSTASGFPYQVGDKIQAAPSIVDINGMKVIFTGCNDNSFYAVNSDGSLRFTLQTGDKVQSSPSFLDYNGVTYIFFGSNDDMIYAVDSEGNVLAGWPLDVNGTIGGSVVFSDLDGDGAPEAVAATDIGDLLAFNLDGSYINYFPIGNDFPSSGSPMIANLDDDGDLEIFVGSGSNLFVVDIKELGSTANYWNMYRGNSQRSGYYMSGDNPECDVSLGDVNGDGDTSILDLVQIVYYILDLSIPEYECAADYNQDGSVDILDLVAIVNIILFDE